jgi:hypothetical protein
MRNVFLLGAAAAAVCSIRNRTLILFERTEQSVRNSWLPFPCRADGAGDGLNSPTMEAFRSEDMNIRCR